MKLNKDTFFEHMEILISVYPNWNIKKDDPAVLKVWYNFFSHMDDERFVYMVAQYIKHEERTPTVAGLKKNDTMPRKSLVQIKHEQMLKENGLL